MFDEKEYNLEFTKEFIVEGKSKDNLITLIKGLCKQPEYTIYEKDEEFEEHILFKYDFKELPKLMNIRLFNDGIIKTEIIISGAGAYGESKISKEAIEAINRNIDFVINKARI